MSGGEVGGLTCWRLWLGGRGRGARGEWAGLDRHVAVEGKGGPGTVANEALQSGPVGGLDPDASVQTEPSAVIPGEHIFGLVGLQEPVAAKVFQDPGTDRVLEALQEFAGEVGGFVEAEAGFWILPPHHTRLFRRGHRRRTGGNEGGG
jgi:hypothetical protein